METFEVEGDTDLDEIPKKTTLDKILQSLYYELYTPFIKDPDEFLDAGEVQMELFPRLALRKFQLYLRHTNKGTYPEFLAYSYMSDIYEGLGQHKKALEARRKVYKLSIDHLICDIGSLLLEEEDNGRIFSLIRITYNDFGDFWSDVISRHKIAISSKPSEFDFNYYERLILRELLQKYVKENPEEAEPILKRIQTDFEEIHPDSKALRDYDLREYVDLREQKIKELKNLREKSVREARESGLNVI